MYDSQKADEKQIGTRVVTPLSLLIWLVGSTVVAVAGPFGTYSRFDFGLRFLYWSVVVGTTILVGRAVRVVMEQKLEDRPEWQVSTIVLCIQVPVLTAIVSALSPLLLGYDPELGPDVSRIGIYVFAVSGLVVFLRYVTQRDQQVEKQEPIFQTPPQARLVKRLPEAMGREIVRLTGKDHFVEVVTMGGVEQLRMRLTDAIHEMEPVEGYCVHRSHWVARSAIERVEREAGKFFVHLVNGDRVPVSRKYQENIENIGLL